MRSIRNVCLCLMLTSLLAGCFGSSATPPELEQERLSPVVAFMVGNAPGASAVVNDTDFGDGVRITLDDAFTSASGESCKRATAFVPLQEPEVIVVCRQGETWVMAPRIWGRATSS